MTGTTTEPTLQEHLPPGWTKRPRYVCASEVGAICGLSPYEGPESIWQRKIEDRRLLQEGDFHGLMKRGIAPNPDIERGNRLERAVAEWTAERLRAQLIYPGRELICESRYAHILAHPDGMLVLDGVEYPLEVKCPRHQDSRSLPAWRAQLAIQVALKDSTRGYMAVFADAELRILTFERDAEFEAHLLSECDKWWDCVLHSRRPDPNGPASSEWLSHNIRQTTKEDATSDSAELADQASRYDRLGKQIKDLELQRDAAAANIKGAILEARGIRGRGWRATWSQSDRRKTNWEQVAMAAGATEEDVERHTKEVQVRTLRVTVD